MSENSSHDLPQHRSLDDLVEFFDAHDMGDYLDRMPEADFTVELKSKRHLVALDTEVADRLTEIAKAQQTSAEALVNSWLKERILKLPEAA